MAETTFKLVPHDTAFRKTPLAKPGAKKAVDALGGEYSALHNMAQTKATQQNRLTPTPKALQKALEQSAKQAQRMADAFGLVVPYSKPRVTSRARTVR